MSPYWKEADISCKERV